MLLVRTKLRVSEIHGIGLFAAERIAEGTPVWRYLDDFDVAVPRAVVDKLSPPAKEQLERYAYLDDETDSYELAGDDARFFNHADQPNTVGVETESGDEVYVACKDIPPDTEITCDYRAFDPNWRTKLGR